MAVLVEPMVVPIAIEAFVDFEFRRASRSKREYVPVLEGALHCILARLFEDLEDSRRVLARRFTERLATSVAWELLPPANSELALPTLIDLLLVRLDRSVTNDFVLAEWRPLGRSGTALECVCTRIEFDDGSLKATINALIGGGAFAVMAAIGIGAAGPIQKELTDYTVRQQITRTYRGEPCFSTASYQIDARRLMEAAAEDLNYLAEIPDEETRRRMCLVQGLLNATGRYDDLLDGKAGPVTQQGLAQVQADHGLSESSIGDVEVRRALLRDWHKVLREMVASQY